MAVQSPEVGHATASRPAPPVVSAPEGTAAVCPHVHAGNPLETGKDVSGLARLVRRLAGRTRATTPPGVVPRGPAFGHLAEPIGPAP